MAVTAFLSIIRCFLFMCWCNYFKLGVYHLNNISDSDEYYQETFHEIRNAHISYGDSE